MTKTMALDAYKQLEQAFSSRRLSNAGRWVLSYLGSYCRPGEHQFRAAGPGREWCTVCYKEQLSDGSCCMVCDQPGELMAEVQGPRRAVLGRLCADCYHGLGEVALESNLRVAPGPA